MADTRGTKTAEPSSTAEKHGRDLQKVNQKLKDLVSSLRAEKVRLAEGRAGAAASAAASVAPPAPPIAPANDVDDAPAIDLEKKRLLAELALAREAVEHANDERARLRDRLAEIEAENQRVCDEYVAVEQRSSELAQLFVSLDRLHGGLTREEVLTALQEIVINVVGTEEFALFEVRGDALELAHSFGVDPEPLRKLPLGEGAIGRAARSGAIYVAGREGAPSAGDRDLSACIPLRVGERVHGAIAIFRLLGHKPVLGESDQVVFDLLSAHAGLALHLRGREPRAAAG
jgi:hypothetical protein